MKKLLDLDLIVKPKDIKIFLGKYNGFQRYDIIKYPFAKQIEANMRQSFWTPEEISLISDRENFKELPDNIKEVVISNLLFQTLMDSAQNRGLDSIMSELVTSGE
ncbi:ribonucleotide-diphosphate reductase subunit beta [bacterium]|nr:ribonucleotide-diphosphate reductase subunit beta [bacterium]MBR2652078.1 ribonucleotide-diphosphate reductase subunit beta [bacterium]MBR2858391.1 ribonucleotide-diphosphate reductase subunit beta [bacterium]